MDTLLLKERFLSRYIINAFSGEVEQVMDDCLRRGITVDLADCRLGPMCRDVIARYYGKVNLIDSKDVDRNEILRNNAEQVSLEFPEWNILPFPREIDFGTLMETVKSLNPNEQWALRPLPKHERQLAFCTMLILMRPDVQFDIEGVGNFIYEFVRDEWLLCSKKHKQFIEFVPPTWFVRDVDERGYMGTGKNGTGKLDWKLYVRHHMCLPIDFGTKNCIEKDANGKIVGEWSLVIDKCVRILTAEKSQRGPILADLLKLREN